MSNDPDYTEVRRALEIYDRAQPDRDALWAAAATEADVLYLEALSEYDRAALAWFFYLATRDRNDLPTVMRHMTIPQIRQLVR